MNIFTKIKRDHDEARDMMNGIIDTPEGEKRIEMFKALKVAILSHAKSEEKTFYQALKKTEELSEEVPHMKKEHKEVEELFEEIETIEPQETLWWEKFGELRQALLHHMEEEEKEIFKDAKKEIPKDTAEVLGNRMDRLEEKEKIKRDESPLAA